MITVNTKNLLKELQWIKRFTEHKTSIPILATVLFRSEPGILHLSSTDLEIFGSTEVPTGHETDDFKACVPVRRMIEYLKRVTDSTVSLSVEEQTLTVKDSTATCTIEGVSVDAWPTLPAPVYSGRLRGLVRAIPRVLMAVSKENSRFTLNGAMFEFDDSESRIVSTDGHRLTVISGKSRLTAPFSLKIPAVGLKELIAAKENVMRAGSDDNYVFFASLKTPRCFGTRKMNGNFPNWRKVMPESVNAPQFDCTAFRNAIEKINGLSTRDSYTLKLYSTPEWVQCDALLDGIGIKLTISSSGAEASVLIGVNVQHLWDVLKLIPAGTPFQLWLKNEASPIKITSDNWQHLLMPMRI